MFKLSSEPIIGPLLDPLQSSGAVVVFEGRVRNSNDGKKVLRLEYEAYEEVAVQEGNRIIEACLARYGAAKAACVHRVGLLELGEVAIRVEVESGHRREAFKACSEIVDQIKASVPIWKKEHYVDGVSEWLNAQPPAKDCEEEYYARQIRLPEIGVKGQAALKAAKILVVGAGGLGAPALLYLAAAGVGTIGICESENLEISNLHRQVLYSADEVGQAKITLAGDRLRKLNPYINVVEHPKALAKANVKEMVEPYDILLDCTDNFETKFLLNDAAVAFGKTLVYASIYQYEGQVFVVEPGGPCLRCIWPSKPQEGCVGNCAEVGVLGFVPGVIGTLQAAEAVKRILHLEGPKAGVLALVDLLDFSISKIAVEKDPDCPACGTGEAEEFWWELQPSSLDELKRFTLIDIREEDELRYDPLPIEADAWLPMSRLDPAAILNAAEGDLLLVCRSGSRTARVAQYFAEQGERRVYSLAGGIKTLKRLTSGY